MKYIIVLLLILVAASSRAQITLEHTYSADNDFGQVEVDSGITKYIELNENDSIYIYNLDHSLEKTIVFTPPLYGQHGILNISKRLFDLDDAYEFLLITVISSSVSADFSLKLFKENGTILFSCDSCNLYSGQNDAATEGYFNRPPIYTTETGTKMLVKDLRVNHNSILVYSLPGKLPGGTAKSGVNSPSIISGNSLPVSAYPNPSNGQMRISYKLLAGESTGELVILTTGGAEVKRYRVGNGFNDILIEKSDLPSGSYFYKLVTDKGESEVQKLIILK
jgi:hypothetical protein